MERIDLQLDVRRLPADSILSSGSGTDSATLRQGVLAARDFAEQRRQRRRMDVQPPVCESVGNRPAEVIESCALGDEQRSFITSMADAESLSGRALVSCLKVARTIADMEQSWDVTCDHLAEALAFRMREGAR